MVVFHQPMNGKICSHQIGSSWIPKFSGWKFQSNRILWNPVSTTKPKLMLSSTGPTDCCRICLVIEAKPCMGKLWYFKHTIFLDLLVRCLEKEFQNYSPKRCHLMVLTPMVRSVTKNLRNTIQDSRIIWMVFIHRDLKSHLPSPSLTWNLKNGWVFNRNLLFQCLIFRCQPLNFRRVNGKYHSSAANCYITPILGCPRKLGSMVSKWGYFTYCTYKWDILRVITYWS